MSSCADQRWLQMEGSLSFVLLPYHCRHAPLIQALETARTPSDLQLSPSQLALLSQVVGRAEDKRHEGPSHNTQSCHPRAVLPDDAPTSAARQGAPDKHFVHGASQPHWPVYDASKGQPPVADTAERDEHSSSRQQVVPPGQARPFAKRKIDSSPEETEEKRARHGLDIGAAPAQSFGVPEAHLREEASGTDMSTFNFASFDATKADCWVELRQRWQKTNGYAPSQVELFWWISKSMLRMGHA